MLKSLFLFSVLFVGSVFAAPRPNIVVCMADDWGWPHAGAYGDTGVSTPNFDRLAREGALFHHAYVSSPSCTPSRNAFITGKFHWELGPGANLWSSLPAEHESFVHLLRDAGYVTGQDRQKTWGPGRIESWAKVHGDPPATGTYPGLQQFLETTAAGKQPFFYWVATSDPHRPFKKGSGARIGIDPAQAHLFPHYPDVPEIRNDVADYYFKVQRWDQKVGQALNALEERGLLENTIVLMTGDHGMPFPRCKGNLYDSGTRVPFTIRWGRGLPQPREIQDFISFTDVAPTLLELAGLPIPDDMTGQSFASWITGPAPKPGQRTSVVFGRERHVPAQEAPNMGGYPSRGIRTSDFLYIRNYMPDRWPAGHPYKDKTNMPGQWYADCDAGPTKEWIIQHKDKDEVHRRAFALCFAKRPGEELYDLVKDPGQLHNVAAEPAYAATLETLRKQLQQRLAETNDPRAKHPTTTEFDQHPYFGSGGGTR